MQKAKWMGLPILILWACLGTGTTSVIFWACADPGVLPEDADLPESAISEPILAPSPLSHSHEEMEAAAEASVADMMERAAIAARTPDPDVAAPIGISVADMRRRMRRTPVQLAPSFFPGFEFSEIARDRRRMAASFNRRAPEARLIGDNQALYDVTLLVLSRGIVHEANFMHRPCGGGPGEFHTACDTALDRNHAELDGPAMYAVFRHTRATGETLIGSIRRHMRYVTEMVPAIRPRSRWITELDLEGNRPTHFPMTDAHGNPLNWERDYLPRWLQVIAMSRRLLSGHDLGPCASTPVVTWGGRCEDAHGACDDDFGIRRGLVPFEFGESSNRFWCRPGTVGCPDAPLPTGPIIAETTPPEVEVEMTSEEATIALAP